MLIVTYANLYISSIGYEEPRRKYTLSPYPERNSVRNNLVRSFPIYLRQTALPSVLSRAAREKLFTSVSSKYWSPLPMFPVEIRQLYFLSHKITIQVYTKSFSEVDVFREVALF